MVETMIARDNLLLDTPFMRRLRREGLEKGLDEGLKKGFKKGQYEGALATRRHDILDVLVLRFEPPISLYQQIEQQLSGLSDEGRLGELFTAAVQAEDMKAFQSVMESIV